MICTACKDLGFPGYSPHVLRHLAGAALAEAGANMDEVMAVLGHLTEDEAREYVRQARRKVMAALRWTSGSERMTIKSDKPRIRERG